MRISSRLIDLSGYVKLDMLYQNVEHKGNYGYNVYNLKGEAPFENFTDLSGIWRMAGSSTKFIQCQSGA